MFILKYARDALRASNSDELATVISNVHCIAEMPFNASYKAGLAMLQKMADEPGLLPPGLSADAKVDALAEEIVITIVRLYFWLHSECEYEEEMAHLFEEATPLALTIEFLAMKLMRSTRKSVWTRL